MSENFGIHNTFMTENSRHTHIFLDEVLLSQFLLFCHNHHNFGDE